MTEKLSRELNHADSVIFKQASTSALLTKKSKKDLDAGEPVCICCVVSPPQSASRLPHLTRLPTCAPAAREHSAALTSKLQAKQEKLERVSAKLADSEAKAMEHEKAATAALQAALDAARDKASDAEAAAAEAHGKALAAALAERDEALQKAAQQERDASTNLQRLEKERDDALQDIDMLTEERKALVAAADRASGLQLAVDDLNNALVRSLCPSFGVLSRHCPSNLPPIDAGGKDRAGGAPAGGARPGGRRSQGGRRRIRSCRRGASLFLAAAAITARSL